MSNVANLVLLSKAVGTGNKYAAAWDLFMAWLPADVRPFTLEGSIVNGAVVALYIADLITGAQERKIGCQLIDTACAAIGHYFAQAGYNSPAKDPQVALLREAAARILTAKKSKCEPITVPELLSLLRSQLTPTCSLKNRMHLTVFLLSFVGLLRFDDVSNILVRKDFIQFVSKPPSDPIPGLDGVVIFLPKSKTDQSGGGAWVAIGATGKEFCPAGLLMQLLQQGGYDLNHPSADTGPLLRAVRYDHRKKTLCLSQTLAPLDQPIPSLSYTSYRQSILLSVAQAGIIKHIGMHAGRTGFSNAAAAQGISSQLVCHHGRWAHGNTFDDTYVRMISERSREFFKLTRIIWNH
jgi:hypothetical protein